jgi:uncharacterized protein with FMN-binding domain
MRRAVLTLSGTVAGLAALFSFRTHVPGVTPVAASSTPAGLSVSAPPSPSPTVSASASASPSRTARKPKPKPSPTKTHSATPTYTTPTAAPPSKQPTTAPTTPAPTKTSAPAKPSGTFTGPSENTQYGAVQVQITVSNGKITNANGSLPDGGDNTAQDALPQLNQEVLTAQSANIQAVSGATYTSNGYTQSLQQAVDQAGL